MGDISRRRLLAWMAAGAAVPYQITYARAGGATGTGAVRDALGARFPGGEPDAVFPQSIMSADPTATGVLLWTRIAPDAYQPRTLLRFEVARDRFFRRLVLVGEVAPERIGPARDYTVQVDLDGRLGSDERYFYRFVYGDQASRTGRCRTAPAAGRLVPRLSFALVSCQDYTNGYYRAFAELATRDDVDFVLHLGDFIYETAGDPAFQALPFADRTLILPSGGQVALDLADYRFLYQRYRSDRNFQRALEQHTFIVIQDDHETANDCYWDAARDTLGAPDHPYTTDPAFGNDPAQLRQLFLDARRAWLEYVPARVRVREDAANPQDYVQLYRRLNFGSLVDLFLTDGRTFRDPHPCGEGSFGERYLPFCDDWRNPGRSMLGERQREWLIEGLLGSRTQWQAWGNQTFFGELSIGEGERRIPLNVDAWDGFAGERAQITAALAEAGRRDLIVLTGDFHSYIAAEVRTDYSRQLLPRPRQLIGAEFMTTSVTSASGLDQLNAAIGRRQADPRLPLPLGNRLVQTQNPHVALFDTALHGYSTVTFTPFWCEWTAYPVDKNDPSADITPRPWQRLRKWAELPGLDRRRLSLLRDRLR